MFNKNRKFIKDRKLILTFSTDENEFEEVHYDKMLILIIRTKHYLSKVLPRSFIFFSFTVAIHHTEIGQAIIN